MYGLNQVCGPLGFQDVPTNPRLEGLQDIVILSVHAKDDRFRFGRDLSNAPGSIHTI